MQRRFAPFHILALAGAAVVLAPSARAQSATDGALRLSVTEATGARLPSLRVVLFDEETGLSRALQLTGSGELLIPALTPSLYSVILVAPGFQTEQTPGLLIHAGETLEVPIKLELAPIITGVTVDTSAPSILDDTPPTALATTLTGDELQRLPVDGRRWQTLALLTPGVVAADSNGGDVGISFRGLAPSQTATVIDGVSDDQSFAAAPHGESGNVDTTPDRGDSPSAEQTGRTNGDQSRRAGVAYTFSQSAIREFRTHSQNYSALYGAAAGGILTSVSKSGTANVHGSALYTVRSSSFAATDPFSTATSYANGVISTQAVKPYDLRQQFAATIGGPVEIPHLHPPGEIFYFAAYDQQLRSYPAVASPNYPGFYSLTASQTALLLNRGVSKAAINTALNYISSLTGTVPRRADQDITFTKVDWQLTAKHRFGLQYNRARWNSPAGARSATVVSRGAASLGNASGAVDTGIARWTWQASSRLVNQLSLQFSRDLESQSAQQPLPQEPSIGPGNQPPEISIGPAGETFLFGTPSNVGGGADPDERRIEVAELLSFEHRRHLFQFGFDASYTTDRINTLANAAGTFRYDSSLINGHAGGLADWITDFTFNVGTYPNGGCPSIYAPIHEFCFRSFSQSFGSAVDTRFSTQDLAFFVEDEWRPRARLLIHAGVRYDYELLPLPQVPNAALDTNFVSLLGNHGATNIFPEDRNNFGPRASIVWQPFGSGNGTVRLGLGVYFGRLPGATIRSALIDTALPASTTSVRFTPTTITPCPQSTNQAGQGFGYACSFVSTPPAAVAKTTSATVFDSRFRLPFVQQGSLAFERSISHGISASVTYLFNLDRQLPNSTDINIAPATHSARFQLAGGSGLPGLDLGRTFTLPVYIARLTSNFGPVTDILSNANATYNALVVEASHAASKGLALRLNWTWSKAIDYGQSSGAVVRQNGQFDPYTLGYDKGLSSLNIPQRLVASAVYTLRIAETHPLSHAALNGFRLSPILIERSGRPYSYDIFGGTRLSGGRESINGSGGSVYLPTIGRNTLRLPLAYAVDLRLSRSFQPLPRRAERLQLRAQADAFNLTNRVTYSGLQQRAFLAGTPVNGTTPLTFQDTATIAQEGLNTRPFGTFNAVNTQSARQIQLGLHLEF